tara:strand:- start:313 stop:567 length:255 start_codon:yes stop_codon:yes gene_type:complete
MWREKESPPRIEKRFEFKNYSKTSSFMKELDYLCESKNIFPNISFGRQFVGITIFLEKEKISNKEKDFSKEIDDIFTNIDIDLS